MCTGQATFDVTKTLHLLYSVLLVSSSQTLSHSLYVRDTGIFYGSKKTKLIFQVYHFCHEDGKQDTFHCGYGTVFNEYIGTCDYQNNVHCQAGEGYIPEPSYQPQHPPEPSYQPQPQHYEQPSFQKPQFGGQFNFDEEIKPFTNFRPF